MAVVELQRRSNGADDQAELARAGKKVLCLASRHGFGIATAESCTGGLVASLLTDQTGLSKWFDRGFVTYSDEAKCDLLGVSPLLIKKHGAVSRQVAAEMARGALARSNAGVALAITGFAGDAGPDDEPGLVYLAAINRSGHFAFEGCHFGDIGRDQTRNLAASVGLRMLDSLLRGRFQVRA